MKFSYLPWDRAVLGIRVPWAFRNVWDPYQGAGIGNLRLNVSYEWFWRNQSNLRLFLPHISMSVWRKWLFENIIWFSYDWKFAWTIWRIRPRSPPPLGVEAAGLRHSRSLPYPKSTTDYIIILIDIVIKSF